MGAPPHALKERSRRQCLSERPLRTWQRVCGAGAELGKPGPRREGRVFAETWEPRGCYPGLGQWDPATEPLVLAPPCVSHGTEFSGRHLSSPEKRPRGSSRAPSPEGR